MTTERWSRPALLVPGLVAAFPATFLWSANFDEIPPLDAWITIGLFMLVGVLVQLAVVLGTRRRRMASSTTSAIASLLNAILFFIVLAAERLPLRFRYGVMLLGGLLTIGIVRLWQKGGHRPGIARALTLMAFASYASLLVRPGLERFERRALRERLRNVPSLTGPISGPATGTSRPDIYLIVLDTYGGPEVLRTVYGADDRPFRDSLRALGFTLPVTRSNYPITAMSLASLLNAAYLDSLGPVLDGHPPALWPYYDLIHRDRLTRFLGSRGYRSYVVPSVPWIGTLVHERAAIHLTTARLGMVAGARLRSVLLFTTWPHTLVGQLWPDAVRWSTPGNVMAAFEGTRELIGRPGPKFVLTHSMAAHFPFSVDRD